MNSFFRKFASRFVTNLKTIIQAAVLSVILWFVVSIQVFPDITLHVPGIKVDCEPTQYMMNENLIITSPSIDDVTVQIQGKRYDISTLSGEDFRAKCDLSGIYESGAYTVNIRVEPVDSSLNCDIISGALTAKVTVTRIITREIPVEPAGSGIKIANGMQIEGDLSVSPAVAIVTGEEKLVNSIDRIEAVPQLDEPLEESTELPARLVYYNTHGAKILNPDVMLDESSFNVSVPVYKVKTLPISVHFANFPENFDKNCLSDYSMSVKELTIASPDSSIDNLESIDIGEISVTSLTLKELQSGVSLPVKLPEGYKNISGNRTVTVYFENYKDFGQLGFDVPAKNISVINAPKNFNVKVLTNLLNVNVVGFSSYVQEMTSDDIYATVNLLGVELSEGSKSVSVTFRIKGSKSKAWVTGEEYKVELLATIAENEPEEEPAESE